MARKNDGACGNPKLIRTDVDCRAARPKFNEGAWSPAKISDMTGGGLYLFATPDESRPGTLPPSSGGCRNGIPQLRCLYAEAPIFQGFPSTVRTVADTLERA